MKKILLSMIGAGLLALTFQANAKAPNEIKVGRKIYDRAFGRGCGTCHDIASNPQLIKLIRSGDLTKESFSDTIKNGKNGSMPAAITQIMTIKPVIKAGYNEDEAIDALWEYLKQ